MDGTRWRSASVLVTLGVVAALQVGKLPPALPSLRAEFGLSLAESGLLVSVFSTLGMVASIGIGVLTPRIGALRLCLIGQSLMVAGGVLGAAAPGLGLLLGARILEGAGFLAVVIATPTLLNLVSAPGDRQRLFGLWGSYMPTGTAIGMLIAPVLIAAGGWRLLWLSIVLCSGVTLVLLVARREQYGGWATQAPAARNAWREAMGPLMAAGPWCIALCFACYVFNYYAIMVWLPTFMVDERQIPLTMAALLTALVVAANVPGNLIGGLLLQRGVSRGAIVCAAGVCTLLTSGVVFAPALADGLRYGACILFSFSVGVLPGSIMSSSQDHARAPSQVATVQGMIMQGSNLGQFASPLLVASVVARAGQAQVDWNRMLLLLMASGVLIVAGGLWLRRLEQQPSTSSRHRRLGPPRT